MLYFAYSFITDHITIDNCYYLLSLYKRKTYWHTNNIKKENNEFKKVRIKNRTCYYFDDIIKLEVFDYDNILIDKKSYESTSIYDISYRTFTGAK